MLEAGEGRDPVVLLVRDGDREIVVKDYAPRSFFVRELVGRLMIRREARAYRALAGHPSVPRFFGRIDAHALAVEYRPGRRMSRKLAGAVPRDFLERLAGAIADMHARGVAHLDLRHRTNVLVDEAGAPVLIDFASAVCFRPGGLGARLFLPLFAAVDRGALRKWQERLATLR
ncbi:MAG TPA: phosphotransferase [Myxococcota bacterium]|nr:phosphotransferase [Myxococcota bacterium]